MKLYAGGPRSRKYHAIPHCDGLNATWTASGTSGTSLIFLISRVDAIGRGLEPCQKCSPPPLLWRVS